MTDPHVSDWLGRFAAGEAAAQAAESWARRTSEEIVAALPEVARVPELADGIGSAVHAHWVAFLDQLCRPDLSFQLPDEAEKMVTVVSRSQLPLETLIRFYRLGQQATWSYITEVVAGIDDDRVDRAEILIYFWDRAASWIDQSISRSVELFHRDRNRARDSADARRFETVRAVLSGETDDARKASADLGGYPMSMRHTALVLACQSHDDLELMNVVARRVARSVGASQPLLVRPGGRQLWCWISTREAVDETVLVDAFEATNHADLRVAIGPTREGLSGFVRSHGEAVRTLDTVAPAPSGGIVAYRDVELIVLLGCSEQVDDFVTRTLGGLSGDSDEAHRLRQTASAYLDSGGSVEGAGQQLTVHRNTVRYRLGRIEEVLGQPLERISSEVALSLRHLACYHANVQPAGMRRTASRPGGSDHVEPAQTST